MMIRPVLGCFLLFLYSCGCFCKVVAGYLLLLKVRFGVGYFWPLLDGSCRFWRDLGFDFSSSTLIKMLIDGYG